MMKTKTLIIINLFIGLFGEVIYFEDFGSGYMPNGYTSEGNWQVSEMWQDPVEDTPPAAMYNYQPIQSNFEHDLTTGYIDVEGNNAVLVRFDFFLDFYQQDELNGLRVAYSGGAGWVDVLDYFIGPDAGDNVDVSRRTESFEAIIEEGADLRVRWTAYGDNSWAINGWVVDNIQVLTLPALENVTIQSSNEDSTTATNGTIIYLDFTSEGEISGTPYVTINGSYCEPEYLGGYSWQSTYTLTESDPDGPIQFTIDFTDLEGINGLTVTEPIPNNDEYIIVDNSDPPYFTVGIASASGGNAFSGVWNTTNTDVQLEIDIPQDSAVYEYNYVPSNSLRFDGIDDNVIIPRITEYEFESQFTVECWVNADGSQDNNVGVLNIAKKNGDIEAGFGFIYNNGTCKFFFQTEDNDATIDLNQLPGISTTQGQWTHIAATYDGDTLRLYKNGNLNDKTGNFSGPLQWVNAPAELTIGNFVLSGDEYYFNGNIDEVRLWNIVRSRQEINSSKAMNISGDATGLVGYWMMNEGLGNTIEDFTGYNTSTGDINSAEWETSSPIDIAEPEYDYDVIVGSAFQLRGRVGGNDFEAFGDKDTITSNDITDWSMIVSASKNDFESIIDFGHDTSVELSAYLFDVAGNYSEGQSSSSLLDIDIIANQPILTNINSDNAYSHLAKTGDLVTIDMIFDENMQEPIASILGNSADVTKIGDKKYQATYELNESDNEGDVSFEITAIDSFGNQNNYETVTNGTNVFFDKTIPILSMVTIESNNTYDTTWAKANDSISLFFNPSEDITADYAINLNGSSEYISTPIGTYFGQNTALSVEAWVNVTGATNGPIFTVTDSPPGGGWNMPFLSINGNTVYGWIWGVNNNTALSHTISSNGWHKLSVTYDPNEETTLHFFVDGQLVASATGQYNSSGAFNFWTTYNPGARPSGVSTYLNGTIDEVSLWNKALSADEVLSNFSGRLEGNEDGLAGYWKFDEGFGSVIYDYSCNDKTGELNNSNYWLYRKGSGPSLIIMNQDVNVSVFNCEKFRADYLTTITDPEGEVEFEIIFQDLVGNDGENVTSTTNSSVVIFDRTPPSQFTVGTVRATGGNEIQDSWNSTNTGLDVTIPIESDSTLKNGWIKVKAKVGDNDFEVLGDSSGILQSDIGINKVLSFSSEQVEGILGFVDEDTIIVKALIIDRPGNRTEGLSSINKLFIDQTIPTISMIHIESNNADSTKAKVGDEISLSFQASKVINEPDITISSNSADPTNINDNDWLASYLMTNQDEEGVIGFNIVSFTDIRGNPGVGTTSTSDESNVVYDRTRPELEIVQLSTNNEWNDQWARIEEEGYFNMQSSENLLSLELMINGNPVIEDWASSSIIDHIYTFTASDQEGTIQFEIIFSDSSGNMGDTTQVATNGSYIIFDNTHPTDFTTGIINPTGGNVVSTFWNSTNTGLDIIIPIDSDSTLDSGRIQILGKIGGNDFENLSNQFFIEEQELGSNKIVSVLGDSIRSMTGYNDSNTIFINAIIFDIPGNETQGTQSTTTLLIDETPPTIQSVSYESNFSDSSLATVGHEITLSFETNEEIQSPNVSISTNDADVSFVDNNLWQATYTMQDGDNEGIIAFQIDTLIDVRGNPVEGTSNTTNGTNVTFDNTPPILELVRIISENVDTTWAKVGDTITITYRSNDILTDESVLIVEQPASISSIEVDENTLYLAKYKMEDSDSEGAVSFEIVVTDTLGLITEPIFETTNSSVVYFDKTLPVLEDVHIESNNVNSSLIAITGDDVILTFSSIEPLLYDSINVTIGDEATILSEDGENYAATLTLDGDEPGGILPYTIDFMDRASNSGVQVTSTTDNSFVNHDIVPPEILTTTIYSNNLDTTWAKPGDTVYVKFGANEPLGYLDIIISGDSSGYFDDGGSIYRGYHIMDSNDSEGEIYFNIEYTDLGGATGPPADSTTDESIVKYDKTLPSLNNIRMSSNNTRVDSAGIGNVDSLFFTASENHRDVIVIIADSNVVPIRNGYNYLATRELFQSDPDGFIDFSITFEDSAGNSTVETITDDNSFVWFDGTPPFINPVTFYSTNSNDTSLAIIGDTMFLDFSSNENIIDISVMIAGLEADTIYMNQQRNPYRSWHILDGSEQEGYIPFQIIFSDLVGNLGDTVTTTTDETSILFDITSPIDFEVDTVFVAGGNIVNGYWNRSNDTIVIITPISLDDESIIGGTIQPKLRFGDSEYISFGSEVDIIDIPANGEFAVVISEDSFESVDGYSEGNNVQFTIMIMDRAGNQTTGLSDNTVLHIDEIVPELEGVNINNRTHDGSEHLRWARIQDTIDVQFTYSEGLKTPDIIINNDTVVPVHGFERWIGFYVVDDQDIEDTISFSISFSDTAGNIGSIVSATSDNTYIIIDKTSPSISNIFEGVNSMDISFYNNADSLTLYWTHEDSLSGIKKTYYSLGSQPNLSNIVNWTMNGENNFGGWNGLDLENNKTYYGSVFVQDSAGNFSDTIYGDGIIIDIESPEAGLFNDGDWILEMDYTPDSTSLDYSWEGFSDNIGIDYYELAIGTENDTTNILDWYTTDSMSTITLDSLDLDRDTLYYTYIKAVDSANNFSTVIRTDGIYFDDSEPRIMEITPDFNDSSKVLSVLSGDTIRIKFNRLIYFYDMQVVSSLDSNFFTENSYEDSVITITWDSNLASKDTLTVYLDSALAYNTLFVSDTVQFFSHLWGDLNYDYDLSIEDILLFNQSWPNTDLGPFLNEPPHVEPNPDGEANLLDLTAFAKMWQWRYFSLSLDSINYAARINNSLNVIGKGSNITFTIPKETYMAEILIGNSNLDIQKIGINNSENNPFIFKSTDLNNKIVQFSIADYKGLDSLLIFKVPKNPSHQFSATIQYRFLGINGDTLDNGISKIDINLLPEKFNVYNNYPNPFNPTTTIRYDLPDSRDVQINIIDIMGRTIISEILKDHKSGRHLFTWNGVNNSGKRVSTGIYFFQIQAGKDLKMKKMLLLK